MIKGHYQLVKEYIKPILEEPLTEEVLQGVKDIIKIVAAQMFLTYLGYRYLSASSKIKYDEIYAIIVKAPVIEEIIFRGFIHNYIYFIQLALDYLGKVKKAKEPKIEKIAEPAEKQERIRFNFVSSFFDDVKVEDPHALEIKIPVLPTEEIIFRAASKALRTLEEVVTKLNENFRFHLASNLFEKDIPKDAQLEVYDVIIDPPIVDELIAQGVVRGIYSFHVIWNWIRGKNVTEDEKQKQLKLIFRVQLAAFIFASAHLTNPHANKSDALTQFVWSYFGGVTYGYLYEKYKTISIGILAHGFNNSLVIAASIYPEEFTKLFFTAIGVNKLGAFILAVTQIDQLLAYPFHRFYRLIVKEKN